MRSFIPRKYILNRMIELLNPITKVVSLRISIMNELILRHHFKYKKRISFNKGINLIINEYIKNNGLADKYTAMKELDKDYHTTKNFFYRKYNWDRDYTDLETYYSRALNTDSCEKEIIRLYRINELKHFLTDIHNIVPSGNLNTMEWLKYDDIEL